VQKLVSTTQIALAALRDFVLYKCT